MGLLDFLWDLTVGLFTVAFLIAIIGAAVFAAAFGDR